VNDGDACILQALLASVASNKCFGLHDTDVDRLDGCSKPQDSLHAWQIAAQAFGAWLDSGIESEIGREDILKLLFGNTVLLC